MQSYINAIGTANPGPGISQRRVASFMMKALGDQDPEVRKKIEVLYRASGIRQRYSVLEDYAKDGIEGFEFFPNNPSLEPFPTIRDRMAVFKEAGIKLGIEAISNCLGSNISSKQITHLITVSCTGMYAPGLDIEIVNHFNINPSVERTAINFMGCYAAFNALKVAHHICQSSPDATVLILCVELCSLHLQKCSTDDSLLANALFGDGAAATVVSNRKLSPKNLALENFHCGLAPQGDQEMTWKIGDFGFEMKLSSYVPAIIKQGIKQLTNRLIDSMEYDLEEVDYYAIHPGGKKILEVIEEELDIPKEKNAAAYHILKNFGNMSSPTILFVLQHLLSEFNETDQDKTVMAFAFGPGLTLESMLMKVQLCTNGHA